MKKRMLLLFGAAMTVMSITGQSAAAAAATPAPATPVVTRVKVSTPSAASAPSAAPAASCPVVRYGYTGNAMCYTWAMDVDWNGDGRRLETFVVAPNRTVWHAWPGSGGWRVMPGNKTADDMENAWWSGTTRNIAVWVNHPTVYWCISDPGSGWTGVWRDC
jgi:hypothetical protein